MKNTYPENHPAAKFVCLAVIVSSLLLGGLAAHAQQLRGRVRDVSTNEELIGATVTVVGPSAKISDITGLDGSYTVKNLTAGAYKISVSYVGYETYTSTIQIANTGENRSNITLKSGSQDLSEVLIVGAASRESDESARKSELKAANITNVVSAKTIEVSPDITIGNVLQRVSGVSMVRSGSGDGQFAIIRGLPNRYTYTSLNGIILPSPDAQTRSIPLDMFPANMMERVEIIKSLTPNVEANAIGGATNLVLKDAPAHLTINGTISTGGSTIFSDRTFSGFDRSKINFSSPSEINGNTYKAQVSDFSVNQLNFKPVSTPLNLVANFSIGNRVLNKRLGFLIGGSYIREYRGSNTLLYTGQSVITNPNTDITANKSEYTAIQNRQYSYLQSRLGMQGKLDYLLAPNHSLKLYGLFLQLDDNQHRYMVQNGLSAGGEIDYFDRVVFTHKTIANAALSGYHKISDRLAADWTASYAVATSRRPDWTDLGSFRQNINAEALFVSNPLTHQWLHSSDADKSGYVNLKYVPNRTIELSIGGMYRSKVRDSFYNTYKLNTVVPGLGVQPFSDINTVIFSFSPAQNAYADSTNANNYSATETVAGLYAMGKFTLGNKLEIVGGVRQETTNQAYNSQISKVLDAKNGTFKYTDVLPSMNLKYRLSDRQNLRASYYSGISRPNILELAPTTISGDLYTEGGNPNLKHTRSQNIDIRYENFFSTNNYIVAGAFYKNLINPIEISFGTVGTSSILQPTNPINPAKDYGIELLFSKFIRNFGISGNYTYIQSEVTTTKLIQGTDKSGSTVGLLADQTRPMQGQSNHIGNLSLLYKSAKSGLNVQLSYLYTGKRISVVSVYYGLDQWQRANSQVDFSVNKSFKNNMTLFLKATNLLNTNIYQDILTENVRSQSGYPDQGNPNRILVQKDVFKQTILAGLRFAL